MAPAPNRAPLVEAPADAEAFNRFFFERHWSEGLPVIPPTPERVGRMLSATRRAPHEVVARVAPAYGAATVEGIAINAVMAGCYPEYLPVLIAAVEAMAMPEFNLQNLQATTNSNAVMLFINGPIVKQLKVNSGNNCLGPGAWANATLGRALRLILQNIGGGFGDMDRATHGSPGKYTLCCAENQDANPWQALHVERGFKTDASTVTVDGPLGTWNINTHAKDPRDLLRVIADTMTYPGSSDYIHGGEPWLMLSPEHAEILRRAGMSKLDVKRQLWEQTKLATNRIAARDLGRIQDARRAELGEFNQDTMIPISQRPEDITIVVAGGPGTHSVYLPTAHCRSVTREIAE